MADDHDLDCAICVDRFQNPCISSCGHSFCTACIMQYWRTLDTSLPVKCPLDRSAISFLSPNHALRERVIAANQGQDEGAASRSEEEAQLLAYNQRFANLPRGIRQELREDLAMYRNLNPSTFQWWLIHGLLILVILYIFMPFDLIPDHLGLVGYLDDAFAFVFIGAVIIIMFNGIRERIIANGVRR